ncbi:hypothetical protein E4665_13600 [Sporolactobacillus shoreae]|uniref:Uncharacterized protein n=1 Tax=Sporolactobacillus shoreae TaxID=1465501 RepID=A0A4Z0GKM1_9BACL|nr:hypothetical protein [Sporolactobacillus shoreae]TGA96892.1 hypothetical protein E4665_13600 [Sporolactobacillus shoreae]
MIYSFFRLFWRDVTYSFSYGKYKYLIFLAYMAALAYAISLRNQSIGTNGLDTFFLLMRDNGYIKTLTDYVIPYYWDFTQFFALFLTADYLIHDFRQNQLYVLLRCQSKRQYIMSKIVWLIIQNLALYLCLFAAVYLASGSVTHDFSLNASSYFHQFIEPMMQSKVSSGLLVTRLLIGFIATSTVLSSLLLLLIHWLQPIIAFFCVVVLCTLSTFLDSKWLPAIHSMILKQDIFDLEHHLTLGFSLAYSACLFLAVSTVTLYICKQRELL